MSAIRVQGGHEREGMRRFPALAADHPLVVGQNECAVCRGQFYAGQETTIIPLGPGTDRNDRDRAREGRWYSALGVIAHSACGGVFGDGVPSRYHEGQEAD